MKKNMPLKINNLIEKNGYTVFGSDTVYRNDNAFLLQVYKNKKQVGEIVIQWDEKENKKLNK